MIKRRSPFYSWADCSPCGACRQFIYEFGADAVVIFPGRERIKEVLARELLPEGFSWSQNFARD